MKTCANCRHSFKAILSKVEQKIGTAKYARCRVSDAAPEAEESLCAMMRKGKCGADAVLWEARDGQA